jgi:hypothetical protein
MKKTTIKMLTVCIALATTTFISCKKDDVTIPDPTYNLEGQWSGASGTGSGSQTNYYALTFKSGGFLTVESNSVVSPSVAFGSWGIIGDSVKATYTYQIGSGTYSMAAKYTSNSDQITGTWGVGTNAYNGGSFTVTKK